MKMALNTQTVRAKDPPNPQKSILSQLLAFSRSINKIFTANILFRKDDDVTFTV